VGDMGFRTWDLGPAIWDPGPETWAWYLVPRTWGLGMSTPLFIYQVAYVHVRVFIGEGQSPVGFVPWRGLAFLSIHPRRSRRCGIRGGRVYRRCDHPVVPSPWSWCNDIVLWCAIPFPLDVGVCAYVPLIDVLINGQRQIDQLCLGSANERCTCGRVVVPVVVHSLIPTCVPMCLPVLSKTPEPPDIR
jgi:hypothetical protein